MDSPNERTIMFEYSQDAPMPPPRESVVLRDAALTYSAMGLAILPVRPGTKKANPEELGGVGYKVSDAGIRNTERVYDIWTRTPHTNIAFPTGAVNGFMVIDIDRKRGGTDPIKALRAWEDETGIEIPIGPTARTPGDSDATTGLHIYLALPEGMEPLGCVNGWLPNVDVRCDGGYVIAPPSHRKGQRYDTDKECPHERESGTACMDAKCEFKLVEDWSPYEWLDMAGDPYLPTPTEWRTDLEAAVAPAELIADIRAWGNTRSRPKGLRHLSAAARNATGTGGSGGGLEAVKWYREHGIPSELAQWDVLYFDLSWPVMNAGASREETVAILREVVDHPDTKLTRPWEPWETGDKNDGTTGPSLWAIVNRAFDRAARMDGDEYHQRKQIKQIEEKYGDLLNLDLFRKRGNDPKGPDL